MRPPNLRPVLRTPIQGKRYPTVHGIHRAPLLVLPALRYILATLSQGKTGVSYSYFYYNQRPSGGIVAVDQTSKFCPICQKQTLWARPGTNHILHLLITVLLLGFWLPIWLMASIRISGWRCQTCGSKGSLTSRFVTPAVSIVLFLVVVSISVDKFSSGTSVPRRKRSSVASNGSTHDTPASETSTTPASKTPTLDEASDGNLELIPYEVVNRDDSPPFKVSYDIKVNAVNGRLPTKEELKHISNHLRSQEEDYERMFVLFYLPGMKMDSGAYATAHHTPRLEGVRVHTSSVPKEFQHLIDPSAAERGPTRCKDLLQLAELYPADLSDFRVISEADIPYFEITCGTFSGDSQSMIDYEIKCSLVMAVGMTFVHTDYDAIKVTVIPEELDPKNRQFTRIESRAMTLAVSKDLALEAYRDHAEIESFSDLVGGMMDDTYFPDFLSPRFANLLLDESKVQKLYKELSSRHGLSRSQSEPLNPDSAKDSAKPVVVPQPQYRTWTDSTGKHTAEAKYSGIALGKVLLRNKDGKTIKVPLERLSEEDQEWIKARKKK